jgi:hypothetical protein
MLWPEGGRRLMFAELPVRFLTINSCPFATPVGSVHETEVLVGRE